MGNPLVVPSFGEGGVNVDSTPLTMRDDELRLAQNAIHRDVRKGDGALSNRNGLKRFTLTPMGGAVLGGIEMPVADTGGAPASGGGGGGTGTAIPGGNTDNLGPGQGIDPSINAGGTTPPGNNLGQSGVLFGGARLLLIGLHDSTVGTTQNGHGFFVTSKKGADTGVISITGSGGAVVGPPGHPTDLIRPGGSDFYAHGTNPYTYANGVLFYGEAFAQSSTSSDSGRAKAKLRRYDGKTDTRACEFPHNELIGSAYAYRSSVVNVIVKYGDGNTLYVAVADAIPIAGGYTGFAGRIFQVTGLDSKVYAVTEIFNSLYAGNGVGLVSDKDTAPYTPYAMEFFGGKLWVGMFRGSIKLDLDVDPFFFRLDVAGTPPDVPQNLFQAADHSVTGESDVSVMKQYNGSLFVGTRNAYNKSGGFSFTYPKIYKIDPDNTQSTSFDFSTTFTHTALTDAMTSSMSVYGGNLYAAIWNTSGGDGAKIMKFDGSSWTVVLSLVNPTGPLLLGQDDGVLYAWGRKSGSANNLYWTTDGTSWTDVGSALPVGGSAKYNPMNFIYGVNQ